MSKVLGEVVSVVFCTGFPVDMEVSLEDAITNPIVSHVNSFASFLFYRIIRDASGVFVVCLERCRWLRVARFASDSFALWKRAPNLASAEEERTFFMMEEKISMVPLMGGGEGWGVGRR